MPGGQKKQNGRKNRRMCRYKLGKKMNRKRKKVGKKKEFPVKLNERSPHKNLLMT
jgi:hypothetical protein